MKKISLLLMPITSMLVLMSCGSTNPQKPVIYHTLKFVSDTCYMKDDIGGQISEKEFEAGEIASFHLDPCEGYLLPLDNQVDFKDTKTGEDFIGTHSYNPTNGDISVKMTADVTIYASNSEDSNYVNEQEFNDACAFTGIQYVQLSGTEVQGPYNTDVEKKLSPSVYYVKTIKTESDNAETYNEEYVWKINDGIYEDASRYSVNDPYTYVDCSYLNFVTPQSEHFTVTSLLEEFGGLTYDSFTYSREEKTYTATFTLMGSYDGVTTLKFNDKKIVNYKTIVSNGTSILISADYAYTYIEQTPDYPKDPTFVTVQQFNRACSFEGVQYVQSNKTIEQSEEQTEKTTEFSPTVFHNCFVAPEYSEYSEQYVQKNNDGTYEKASRYEKEGAFTFEETDEGDFLTPQNDNEFNVMSLLENYEVDYDSFTYNKSLGTYIAETVKASMNITLTLEFNNKKLTKFTTSYSTGLFSVSTYTYNETTPDFPENSTFVTEEQFDKACSFEGVQYVQSETTTGTTPQGTEIREFSPTVYHDFTNDGIESYVRKNDDGTYERADLDELGEEFIFSEAEEEDFLTPQTDNEFNVLHLLKDILQIGYDSFTYNGSLGTFTAETEQESVTFTLTLEFNNEKLIKFTKLIGSSSPSVSEYTYEETTPEFPEKP